MTQELNSRGRILVVEDQGVVATDIERCLEDGGFEVTGIATSMQEAIREVSAVRPDLILMDIRINGEADGVQTADYLRRHFGVPVVFLTAHDDRDTLDRAKRTGPMAFLLKPFKPAELTSTVEIALRRDRAEQQARERERWFLSAMDSIGEGVVTADSRGLIRFMNRAAQAFTGWTEEDALGRHAAEVIRLADGQNAGSNPLGDLLDANNSAEFERDYRTRSLNGGARWLMLKATTIPGANDTLIRIIIMRDVTQRRLSEEALRRQAGLLDQSHEAILTWDLDGAIHFWNHGAQRLYGYTSRQALGLTVGQLLPVAAPLATNAWEAALERDGTWSGELTRRTRDGREIVVETVLVAVQDSSGQTTVLETDRDVTDRKSTEREILRLNQELKARVNELTELNRELEAFNYSISHDLRAPLRHINGFSRILLEDPKLALPEDACGHLETIRAAACKMGSMVDALLELSRASRKEPARRPTELRGLIDDVLLELKSEARDRQIEWRIADLPAIDCDPALTRQVFANLLANAVKFTRDRRPAVIEIGQLPSSEEGIFFVRDNGAGFDMKYAGQLFGVFQRLHRDEDFGGTGIGLAIVHRIVNRHGGRVWAEAKPGEGAAFYFTLAPAAAHPPPLQECAEDLEQVDA